jgi:hypothetical protein
MTLSRSLAGWIMQLATRRPPPARTEWALAMEREYETLERGALGWAVGCLTTRIGWTLRAQWLYILLLSVSAIYSYWMMVLVFDLGWYNIIPRHAISSLLNNYGVLFLLFQPLPLAILLGFYRPGRIGTTLIVGCILGQYFGAPLYVGSTLSEVFSGWTEGSLRNGIPPLYDLCANLWVWYMGASLGARLAWRRASRTAVSPDPRW